ncbi:hypothetical protein TNCV_3905051 [Trichonephila clavipes]|nr:hypothetical protein TNCV_3905051 [Trichonephila clavipes]
MTFLEAFQRLLKVIADGTYLVSCEAFEECYDSQRFKCEDGFEKLSDSQEKLCVIESLRSRCIPLHASEPQIQQGSGFIMCLFERSSPGEDPRLVLDIWVNVSSEYSHGFYAVKDGFVKSTPCHP